MKHIDLLYKIGELNTIFKDSSSLPKVMDKMVHALVDFFKSSICSIYIYDESTEFLTLQANVGFSPGAVGKVKMKITEGLAGLSLRESKVVYEKSGSDSPHFKRFANINEEQFDSFLVVPLIRGLTKLGVPVLQREEGRVFSKDEIKVSKIIASQLSIIIENARLMGYIGSLYQVKRRKQKLEYAFIQGKVASEGNYYAGIFKISQLNPLEFFKEKRFEKKYTKDEFIQAIELTEDNLTNLQKFIEKDFSEAVSLIFGTHLMIMKDPNFRGEIIKLIDKGENPPIALIHVATNYINLLLKSPNDYIKEKTKDLEDITLRILNNLVKKEMAIPGVKDKIVIARELLLSDLIRLYSEKAGGIILHKGGVTSHLSILARTLKIPVIISDDARLFDLPESTKILLDAAVGNIYINPGDEIISQFKNQNKTRLELGKTKKIESPETFTKDKKRIQVMININLLSDMKMLENMPYDGIGLYRTEMPFLVRRDFPDEDEQLNIYKKLADGAKGKEVIFRTLDIGGDKALPYINSAAEHNPFLGLRSIRFSLRNPAVFRQQINAILRAGFNADIKIMFPMVSSIEEFTSAKNFVLDCMDDLSKAKVPFNNHVPVGMMIELPSVVELMDDFCKISDFFSIGTNDLVQYMLAVDRTNENVAYMYVPHHPSVLRALYHIISVSGKYKKEVSICGDMANKSEYLRFLIGAGIGKISVEPAGFSKVKDSISRIDTAEAEKMVQKVLKMNTIAEIEKLLF